MSKKRGAVSPKLDDYISEKKEQKNVMIDHDSKENKCQHVIVITCAAEGKENESVMTQGRVRR